MLLRNADNVHTNTIFAVCKQLAMSDVGTFTLVLWMTSIFYLVYYTHCFFQHFVEIKNTHYKLTVLYFLITV